MDNDITQPLETMIDKHGLQHVMTALELICREKADHIEANYQDTHLAKQWDKAANVIYRAAANKAVAELP